jgi:uncharacterized protein involved in exopolysaccharide biosynthesis
LEADDRVSLFALGTTVLRSRWLIIRWTLIGGAIAVLTVVFKPPEYAATASFIPEGVTPNRSGLASLAGQFGLSLPAGDVSRSPDFYVQLIRSRERLIPIVRNRFTVQEMRGKVVPFLDLFEIGGASAKIREDRGVESLMSMITPSAVRTTGVVQLSVSTRWPSVSLAIATALLDGVNDFNRQTRQTQAAAERKFVEEQLGLSRAELRSAEERLKDFRRNNRQIASSPELTLEDERLQREVIFQQQVVTTLMQSYEEARIREVRDTPTITVVEAPSVRPVPEPRKRIQRGLLGLLTGAIIGVIIALGSEILDRRRDLGDPDADAFVGVLRETIRTPLGGVRWLRRRLRR